MIDPTVSWNRAWAGLHAVGQGVAVFRALITSYSEPHRKYHTLQHLDECLSTFESVRHLAQYPAEVEIALWFHDAVYDVRRQDNEQRSADWAVDVLHQAGVSAESVARVAALVMATRHSALPVASDEQLLVDVDLSILAAPALRFAEYEQQIREEYRHVPGFLFRWKRRAILRTFLDRPHIYSTSHFHAAWEERARDNLRLASGQG